MQLNNFSSFFEIMAGLNLAYATSDWFQSAIDRKIQKIDQVKKVAERKIELVKSQTLVVEEFHPNSELISQNLKSLNEKIAKAEQIKQGEETFEKIKSGYRSIFLMTALYCFSIILLGGFEQFFDFPNDLIPKTKSQHILTNIFLFSLHFAIIYNLYVFIRSHSILINTCWLFVKTKVLRSKSDKAPTNNNYVTNFVKNNFLNYEKDTNKLLIVILWIFWIFIVYFFIFYFPFEVFKLKTNWQTSYAQGLLPWGSKTNLLLALLVAISSYLLHFLRVYIHDVKYFYNLMKFNMGLEQMIQQFEQNVELYAIKNEPLPLPTINEPDDLTKQWSELWKSFCIKAKILFNALRRKMDIPDNLMSENEHNAGLKP